MLSIPKKLTALALFALLVGCSDSRFDSRPPEACTPTGQYGYREENTGSMKFPNVQKVKYEKYNCSYETWMKAQ